MQGRGVGHFSDRLVYQSRKYKSKVQIRARDRSRNIIVKVKDEKVGKFYRKIYWVIHDLVFINSALILSLILRFGRDWTQHCYQCKELFIYFSISYIIFAILFRLYKRIWRYISINDLFLITGIVSAAIITSLLYLNLVIKIYIP